MAWQGLKLTYEWRKADPYTWPGANGQCAALNRLELKEMINTEMWPIRARRAKREATTTTITATNFLKAETEKLPEKGSESFR